MPSDSLIHSLTDPQRALLLDTARRSIEHGLAHGKPFPVSALDPDPALRVLRASFVTLEKQGQLRGCIGSLEALRPLIEDIAHNAFATAFEDPRFDPVHADEWPALEVRVSVLTQLTLISVTSREDLLVQCRPGIDGLVFQEGRRKATFLPAVWESLPTPDLFISNLFCKGGWSADYWSEKLRVYRYEAEYIR